MKWTLRIFGYEVLAWRTAPARADQRAFPAARRPAPSSEEETFDRIVDDEPDLSETIVVAFSERPDGCVVGYDLTGTDDLDYAIAVATKGLMTLIMDCNGTWERVDGDEFGDDEP